MQRTLSFTCCFALTFTISLTAGTCESLTSLSLSNTTITMAQSVSAGGLTVQAGPLPAFCRVAATLKPSSDSDIRMEVWLPVDNWNGKLLSNGNGGWSGSISQASLASGLRRRYASAMSDLGHEGGSGSFALGHPEKLIDFGYRAAHEMTVAAKSIITAFYLDAPKYSYWSGCSAGGRSAMMEAQRYPNDYDGIIAGSPGLNWTGRALLAMWIAQANHTDEAGYIPPAKYAPLHQAALHACDAADGVTDGVIEDPTRCHFDPSELLCNGEDNPSCLTAPQVATAKAVYSGVINRRTQAAFAPGFERGSEIGWATMGGPQPLGLGYDLFRYVVFQDAAWPFKAFDFDHDLDRTMKAEGGILNAMNPNLKAFLSHGKLIQYHGWADPQIAPFTSVQYYESVEKTLGRVAIDNSYRLFMVPGMAHCGGGDGTSTFDMIDTLEQWVEHGKTPDQVSASRTRAGKTDRTRPLCPWPQVAVYKGQGSTDDSANFSCRVTDRK